MPCIHCNIGGSPAILMVGGPDQIIIVNGRRILFEWGDYGGPAVLNPSDLSIKANQPGGRNPFWDAATWWDRQGRRMKDGVCVWNRELPEIPILERDARNRLIIVGVERGECCELVPGQ